MKNLKLHIILIFLATGLVSGCYTQVATSDDFTGYSNQQNYSEENYYSEEEPVDSSYYAEEENSYTEGDTNVVYEETIIVPSYRRYLAYYYPSFYFDYYPSYYWGFSFGFYNVYPWPYYGWCGYSWYYPYYCYYPSYWYWGGYYGYPYYDPYYYGHYSGYYSYYNTRSDYISRIRGNSGGRNITRTRDAFTSNSTTGVDRTRDRISSGKELTNLDRQRDNTSTGTFSRSDIKSTDKVRKTLGRTDIDNTKTGRINQNDGSGKFSTRDSKDKVISKDLNRTPKKEYLGNKRGNNSTGLNRDKILRNYSTDRNTVKKNSGNRNPTQKQYIPKNKSNNKTYRDQKTTPPKSYNPPRQNNNPPKTYSPPRSNTTPKTYSPPPSRNSGNSGNHNSGGSRNNSSGRRR